MVIAPERTRPAARRRLVTAASWLLVVPFAIWALIRLLGLERGFPEVQLLAFTPYVAVASLAPVVVAALTRRVWPALGAAVVALALAACVLPRWLTDAESGPATHGGPTLRVLSVNMLMGSADPAMIVNLVRSRQVDLLAVQEFTTPARSALDQAGLRELLPHQVGYPLSGVRGSALYSRFPLADGGFREHTSGFGQALATVSVPGAAEVHVESVHPCAPSERSRSTCWNADLADQPAATVSGPVRLLIGDFNATLDHAELRRLINTGYRDAADVVGAGFAHTWPYDEKWYVPGIAIDHVLADRRVGVKEVSTHALAGSDHRALCATLQLPPR